MARVHYDPNPLSMEAANETPSQPQGQKSPTAAAPPTPRTAREMLELARAFLERKGLESARLEAELLVSHALGLDRLRLFMRLDQPILTEEIDQARALLVRRGRREPTAYIVGKREFYARDFAVGTGVLIPRPETELLVDLARDHVKGRDSEELRILDVGTGSGCLAVTLALELPGAEVHAIDVSGDALRWAAGNAETLGANVQFHEGDGMGTALALAADGGPFDVVVSNPPYVETSEESLLAPEVRDHEPGLALYAPPGEPDRWAVDLMGQSGALLRKDGVLLVELGHLQGPRLKTRYGDAVTVHDDLSGIPRVLEHRRL